MSYIFDAFRPYGTHVAAAIFADGSAFGDRRLIADFEAGRANAERRYLHMQTRLCELAKQRLNLNQILLSVLLVISCCTWMARAQAGAESVSPQSLAGEWENKFTPALRMVLHLEVEKTGTMSGRIDVPGQQSALVLGNVHLDGSKLIYTVPGLGTLTEFVSADGKTIIGPERWERPAPPVVEAPERLVGDWEWTIGGPLKALLRLRLTGRHTLTGTIDFPPRRLNLKDVRLDGTTVQFSFSNPSETKFAGILSDDGKSIDNPLMRWVRVRTAAQATAADAQYKPSPVDGAWSGVSQHVVWAGPGPAWMRLKTYTLHFTFHFGSAPVFCGVDSPDAGGGGQLPCRMRLDGDEIHVDVLGLEATYQGTLSGDGTHLSGILTTRAPFHYKPMQLDLVRTAMAPGARP